LFIFVNRTSNIIQRHMSPAQIVPST
jgi:hypothetical protein